MQTYPMLWVVLGSIAIGVSTAILLLAISEYNQRFDAGDIVGIIIGVFAFVIGVFIAFHQNRQSDELHDQTRRIENQGNDIRDIVNGLEQRGAEIRTVLTRVNEQNERIGDVVQRVDQQINEVRTMNAQVRDMIKAVKVREDRRKNYHLYHVKEHTVGFKKHVVKAVEITEHKYVENPRPTDEKEDERIRGNLQNRIKHLQWRMDQIRYHFGEVKDLMNSPSLASKFNVNYLWSTVDALADVVLHTEPVYDQQDLVNSLQELKDEQIPKLDQAIQEIEQEIPKMGSDRHSEHEGRQDTLTM